MLTCFNVQNHNFSNTVHYFLYAPPLSNESPSFRQALSALIGQLTQSIAIGRAPQARVGGGGGNVMSRIELQQPHLSHSANGWHVVPVSSSAVEGRAGAMLQQPQYVMASSQSMQSQLVFTTLSGVMPSVQYQMIPQFQTMDGQQL